VIGIITETIRRVIVAATIVIVVIRIVTAEGAISILG
jgi:hypothetical protein